MGGPRCKVCGKYMKRERQMEQLYNFKKSYVCIHATKTPGIIEINRIVTPKYPLEYVTLKLDIDLKS